MGHRAAICIGGPRRLTARHSELGVPSGPRRTARRLTVAGAVRGARGEASKAATSPKQGQKRAVEQRKVSIVDKTLDVVNTKTGPLLWSAGLLVLGVAVAQTVHRLIKLRLENGRTSSSLGASTSLASSASDSQSSVTSDHSILFSELEAKLMSPLLLAAETSAEVDETSTMSVAELEDLEVTLRTLLSGMDAQLEELRRELLDQGMIPDDVLNAMDTIDVVDAVGSGGAVETIDDADGDAWREFKLFERYVGDQERRSFRSLLYNRSVQIKLLHQVERQIEAKRQTDGRDRAIGGYVPRGPIDPAGDGSGPSGDDRGQFFYAAGATAPHALKKTRGGEDAFFVDNMAMVIGVADGVGAYL